jgi:hypothetical protein
MPRVTETGTSKERQIAWQLVAAWIVWALALVWYLLRGLVDLLISPCAQLWYDGSGYGEPAWQWAPPGVSCTYFAEGSETAITLVTYPSWGPVVIALLLLAFPIAATRRRA